MQTFRITSIAILTLTGIANAHVHFDISPVRDGDKIRVDGLSHGAFENPWTAESTGVNQFRYIQYDQRVFEYEFGEDPFLPFFAEDPGVARDAPSAIPETATYDAISGTYDQSVSASSTGLRNVNLDRIQFQIIDDLKFWNGSTFVAVPDGETLDFTLSGANRTVGTGTGAIASIPMSWNGVFPADGLHLHAGSELIGTGGVNPDPTNGAYLLTVQLHSTISGVESSDPIYIVFGLGIDEETHEAAIDYASNVLVPEPASLGLLGLGSLFLRRRR